MTERKYLYNVSLMSTVLLLTELAVLGLILLFYFVIRHQITGLRLEHPQLIWISFAGLAISGGFILYAKWKNKALTRFADANLLASVSQPISTGKALFKFLLYRLAFAFLVIALVNPRIGSKVGEGKSQGINLMVCLDVSNSMMAEDIKPNRLSRAKRAIEQLVDELHGDKVGIIIFAGDAYVQLPLTTDYGAAKLFLSTVGPDMVPTQGTAIGKAVDLAVQSFDFEKQDEAKAIILITDGENHEDDAVSSAQYAADNNIKVYTIGMGSEQGAPIPVIKRGKQVDFKKDKDGQVVVSTLNQDALAQVAAAGNGLFVRASTRDAGISGIVKELEKQNKSEFDSVVYLDYEDRFQVFLGLALLLLLVDVFITEKRSKLADKIKLFEK